MKLYTSVTLVYLLLILRFGKTQLLPEFSIDQGNTEHSLSATHTDLSIEKKAFSISFNCKEYKDMEFHAARIGVFLNRAQLDKIKPGISTSDIDFFSLGTGYATSGPYDPFYIHSEDAGHHYVSYEKDGDKRAELVSEKDNGILRLKCNVNHLSIDGETIPVEKAEIETLYLALFYDVNLNATLDAGEFKTASISFNSAGN